MEQQEVAANPLKTRRGGWFAIVILGRPMSYRKPGQLHLMDEEVGKWKWGIYLLLETRSDAFSTTKLQTVYGLFAKQLKDIYSNLNTLTYWLQTKVSVDRVRLLPCIREITKWTPSQILAVWSRQIILYIRIRADGWNVHTVSHVRPEVANKWTNLYTSSESLFSLRIRALGGSNCGRIQLEKSSREVRMFRSVFQRQLSRQ